MRAGRASAVGFRSSDSSRPCLTSVPRAVPAHSLCVWPGRPPLQPGSSDRRPPRPPHARGAAKAMPPTRGAILAPHRLKVTYEAPTRTRAKVQQSIDARSACLEAQTVT